ncbi:hypothetical protein Tco_0186488 [Tanacetum coccineum]
MAPQRSKSEQAGRNGRRGGASLPQLYYQHSLQQHFAIRASPGQQRQARGSRYNVPPAGLDTTSRNQEHDTTSTNQSSSMNDCMTAINNLQQQNISASRKRQPTAETMQTAGTHTLSAEMNPPAEVCPPA